MGLFGRNLLSADACKTGQTLNFMIRLLWIWLIRAKVKDLTNPVVPEVSSVLYRAKFS